MSLNISPDTTIHLATNADGSITLRFKQPLETETTTELTNTEIANTADTAAAAAAAADNNTTATFALKRHKGAVFDEKLTLAKSLVAIEGNEARSTALERMFVARCEEQPGDDLIETHRKFFFTLSSQRGSVLSLAQTLDPTFPTIKMGKLVGLKTLNDRKLSLQTTTLEHKQQTGRLVIRDGQQMFSALYDTAKTVVLTEPTDETAVLCEDLLRFNLQLRVNEGCPHTARDDGHKLVMDDFVVQDRI